ncbi:MAG TPA: hypothetical protein VL485_11120 [Ktedonobacteraceae bacterium]|jgi:hypothetical protein|nr:hypothetical protein [Ktedonobacteraceae bacterium]
MIEADDVDCSLAVPCLEERHDLGCYLEQIWRAYFADTPRVNEVTIGYCYPWKSRLGLIRLSLDHCVSFIGVNTLLQSPLIPEYVVLVTIAHELAHYAHGFGSPLPRLCSHPHANRVVDRELESRALGVQLRCCNEWIDKNWLSFYYKQRDMGWADLYGTCRASALS